MIATCAGCDKPVYPAEKLSCLDRAWHKSCFKCQECGMPLSLRNYKGYQKKPYCGPHYPKVKYTQVADTPENSRLKSNSEVMSKAKYQEEFRKSKGSYTQVADNLEQIRLQETSDAVSKAKYTAEFHRMKGNKLSVADDVNSKHWRQVQDQTSNYKYQKDFNDQIKGHVTSTADELKTEYLKGMQDKISNTKYQEEFKKNIVGTKTSVKDDIMINHFIDTQSKVTDIGYRKKTESTSSSRPVSMNLSEVFPTSEDAPSNAPSDAPSNDRNKHDNGRNDSGIVEDVADDVTPCGAPPNQSLPTPVTPGAGGNVMSLQPDTQVSSPGPGEKEGDLEDDDVFDHSESREELRAGMLKSGSSSSLLDSQQNMTEFSSLSNIAGSVSPVSVSVGKLRRIKTISDSISIFRTTLTHGALSRLIGDDDK